MKTTFLFGKPDSGKTTICGQLLFRLKQHGWHEIVAFRNHNGRILQSKREFQLDTVSTDFHEDFTGVFKGIIDGKEIVVAISSEGDDRHFIDKGLEKIKAICDEHHLKVDYLFLTSHPSQAHTYATQKVYELFPEGAEADYYSFATSRVQETNDPTVVLQQKNWFLDYILTTINLTI
ncbi:hypothetical protein [Lactiplantibacillus herbarum]|uniref:hypothetical protein n=1 Tax=Lactiplantibacillus herbarum TaxID=1670446 RepID=UPI00064ECD88|nr:hypothetical protein [Lactiplantibacillus herbarum]